MQQETTCSEEARMSRQDKAVLVFFVLDILVIIFWSLTLHLGTNAAKNTKREKNAFHSQIIQLPVNLAQRKMVDTAIPFISRTKEDTVLRVSSANLNVSKTANSGRLGPRLSNQAAAIVVDYIAITNSVSKSTSAINNVLDSFDLNEFMASAAPVTTATTTTTTTTTTTITTMTEKIVEETVPPVQADEAIAEEPAPKPETEAESETKSDAETVPAKPQPAYAAYCSYTEYLMICNVVGHEYGADWVDIAEKALVAEVIMNRVHNSAFPSTVEQVLVAPYQFSGAQSWAVSYAYQGAFSPWVTESVKNAVNYYFEHISDYQHGYLYFWGDGWRNHFS